MQFRPYLNSALKHIRTTSVMLAKNLLTVPWIFLVGIVGLISVFFFFAMNTQLANVPDRNADYLTTDVFRNNVQLSPINYYQYYWVFFCFVMLNFLAAQFLPKNLRRAQAVLFITSLFYCGLFIFAIYPLVANSLLGN